MNAPLTQPSASARQQALLRECFELARAHPFYQTLYCGVDCADAAQPLEKAVLQAALASFAPEREASGLYLVRSGGSTQAALIFPVDIAENLAQRQALADRLSVGDITLVVAERSAQVTGQPLNLARREIALLELFMRRPGRVVTKAEIERAIYGFDDEVTGNTIEVLIHRLRKRLSDAGSRVGLETLRGIGDVLRDAGT